MNPRTYWLIGLLALVVVAVNLVIRLLGAGLMWKVVRQL